MAKFEKGRQKTGGKKRGTVNKTTLLFKGIAEEDKELIIRKAMQLVKKGNVTIINKLLDKLFFNAIPKDEESNISMPEITFNVIDNWQYTTHNEKR